MSNEFQDAIRVIRKKRADAVDVVRKYDEALKVLIELDMEPHVATASAQGPTPIRPAPKNGLSAIDKVIRLMDEANRPWTVAEILDEYKRRGDPFESKNPKNAIRTALIDALKRGKVNRLATGVYLSAQHPIPSTSAEAIESASIAPTGTEHRFKGG